MRAAAKKRPRAGGAASNPSDCCWGVAEGRIAAAVGEGIDIVAPMTPATPVAAPGVIPTGVRGRAGFWTVVFAITARARSVFEASIKRRNSVKSLYETEAPARFVNSKSIDWPGRGEWMSKLYKIAFNVNQGQSALWETGVSGLN